MLKDFIGYIQPVMPFLSIITGSLSALLGVVLANYLNSRREERNFREQQRQKYRERKLEKLEELAFLFEKWESHCVVLYVQLAVAYMGGMKNDELTDIRNRNKEFLSLEKGDVSKIHAIIFIYFKELNESFEKIQVPLNTLTEYHLNLVLSKNTDPVKTMREILHYRDVFAQACDDFKKSMIELGEKFNIDKG
ncbi:MAG: hypothetical protein QM537_06240 [Candidatus Symbiobacter sp.]|nr:hypothetical protein [Candidatus Symbiobacter sp.]